MLQTSAEQSRKILSIESGVFTLLKKVSTCLSWRLYFLSAEVKNCSSLQLTCYIVSSFGHIQLMQLQSWLIKGFSVCVSGYWRSGVKDVLLEQWSELEGANTRGRWAYHAERGRGVFITPPSGNSSTHPRYRKLLRSSVLLSVFALY